MTHNAFRIGAVEGGTGEELRRHTATLARVVGPAGGTGPRTLGFAEGEKKRRRPPHVRETSRVTNAAGFELGMQHEGAGVHVADRVDQADDPAGAAEVEAG